MVHPTLRYDIWTSTHLHGSASLPEYDGYASDFTNPGEHSLHDPHELALPIAHGVYDVPLVIEDAMFTTGGELIFDDRGASGMFGDVILVNGRPWPRMPVERRKYRSGSSTRRSRARTSSPSAPATRSR